MVSKDDAVDEALDERVVREEDVETIEPAIVSEEKMKGVFLRLDRLLWVALSNLRRGLIAGINGVFSRMKGGLKRTLRD
jgi:hypothetical protein